MANNKSARKRIEISERNRLRNRFYKSSVRTLMKKFFKELEIYKLSKQEKEKDNLQKTLNLVYSLIDKGTKKNIFHKNNAAKKKARLASYMKAS
jgi:small subunit ribosomal protein S20